VPPEVWACGRNQVSRKKSKSWEEALAQARNSLQASSNHPAAAAVRPVRRPAAGRPPPIPGRWTVKAARRFSSTGALGSGCETLPGRGPDTAHALVRVVPSRRDLKHSGGAPPLRLGGVDKTPTDDRSGRFPILKVPNGLPAGYG